MGTRPMTVEYLNAAVSLQFTNSTDSKNWIASLPLTNVQQAQQALSAQVTVLAATQLPALERLKILETLKDALVFLQEESAKRFAGKPLPLDAAEAEAWDNVIALWQDLGRNYQTCLQAYRDGDLAIAPHVALVNMRCLRYLGCTMFDYCRAYRQVPGAMWRALHELYSFSEQHGYARIRVQDSFAKQDPDSSCAESYIQTLLVHLASPYSLSVRQMSFAHRWLEKWTALVGLASQPLPPSPIPSLVVDLGSTSGVTLAADIEPQPNLRYLDLEQLSKTLRQVINLLKQGQTPAQLGLGSDARQPGCENLLMLLYVQWCRAGTARSEDRCLAEAPVSVCLGIPAVHFHLSGGRAFRQPGELTSRERQDIDTFGYITRVEIAGRDTGEEALEPWEILNHSASGFMCMQRNLNEGKARVSHNQLLAVRRADSTQLRLGLVQWLKIDENSSLSCGVRLFPGIPQAIAVRPSNFNPVGSTRYERAILLPEVAVPNTPATLILPAGWFQNGRFVEVHSDRKQVAKLLNLLEKGSDFDRGTITIV